MELRIFHTVNEGLYLWNGKSGLLIDALHGGAAEGFSDMPKRYERLMLERKSFFGKTNDLLFTHLHPDHYSAPLVEAFTARNPDRLIYAPGYGGNNVPSVPAGDGCDVFPFRDYRVYAFWTEHDGKKYAEVPHRSYLVECGDERIFIGGDALFSDELAKRVNAACGGRQIDRAFVNVYQIINRRQQAFLQETAPREIWLYHLPYLQDDRDGYYRMAERGISRCNRLGITVNRLKHDSFMDGGQKNEKD